MPLGFDSFGDRQRIFKLDAEVPDRAVHLGVTQKKLDCPEARSYGKCWQKQITCTE
jgi:hypothetical protein